MSPAQAEKAADAFQQAAIFPELWPAALDAVAAACASQGASLASFSGTQAERLRRLTARAGSHSDAPRAVLGPIAAWSHSLDYAVQPYLTKPMRDPRIERLTSANVGAHFVPDLAHFSSEEISRDDYYQALLPELDLGWHAAAAIHDDLVLTLRRGRRAGPYEESELRTFDSLLVALRRAARTARMSWQCRFTGQLEAFSLMGRGAVLLDRHGRVLDSNSLAEFARSLVRSGGRLRATYDPDDLALQDLLRLLTAPEASGDDRPLSVILRCPERSAPLLLDGIVHVSALRSLHADAVALMLITDLAVGDGPDAKLLAAAFGLTSTEAALAARLRAGESLQQAACGMCISYEHARQRLKVVFEKTGTSRQGELIALLSRFPESPHAA